MIYHGVYGYEITREYQLDGMIVYPIHKNHIDVTPLARSKYEYHLTAVIEFSNNSDLKQRIFDLEAILSFIDHRRVVIRNSVTSSSIEEAVKKLPSVFHSHARNNGGGEMIMSDTLSPNSRPQFINLAQDKLTDTNAKSHTEFRQCFFKSILHFTMAEPYIDVQYYLLFSGLEALARKETQTFDGPVVKPIADFLKSFDFTIYETNYDSRYASVSTYAHLRNAVFHNGDYEKEVNENGRMTTYNLSTYFSNFRRLVPLVLVKYIGFDDGRINWNCWLDRNQFKSGRS